tara:strand:- start:1567 stop:2631 length:1065 start_codon:yes stop_codon:yes gene_type:complete
MRRHLDGLQILRALAAVVVVFHHLFYHLDIRLYGETLTNDFQMGGRGVQLFFVLSGFIIYYIHRQDSTGWAPARLYLYKRLVRIFPLTFLVATGWALATLVMSQVGLSERQPDLATWLTSAFILPPLAKPDPIVIWTLRHELFFYAIFLLGFFSRPAFFVAMGVWVLAALAFPTGLSPESAVGWQLLTVLARSNINILFAMGLVTAILVAQRKSDRDLTWLFVTGIVLLFAAGGLFGMQDFGRTETLIFGLISALTIYAAAGSKVTSRPLVFLGDASFSIYLVHLPVIALLAPFLVPALGGISYLLAMVVIATLAIGLCCLFYMLVERPLIRALKPRKAMADQSKTRSRVNQKA